MYKSLKQSFLLPLVLAVLAFKSPLAMADNETMRKLIDVLETNGSIDAESARVLRDSMEDGGTEHDDKPDEATFILKDGKLKGKSNDGDFQFAVGGRLMADYAWYDEDATELGDGAEIRRARIVVKGSAYEYWHFVGQYDFVGDDDHLRDVYMKYTGRPGWEFYAGHFKQPFSMEQQTSSKVITFMERALPHAFSPVRDVGVAAGYGGGAWHAKVGIFSSTNSSGDDGVFGEGDSGWDLTGRLHFAPMNNDDAVLHLGVAGSHRWMEDSRFRAGDPTPTTDNLRFRARPESHVTDERLVDVRVPDADTLVRYGLEAGFRLGPLSAMGEYMQVSVDRDNGAGVDFSGYYGQVSYVLTGEARSYKSSSGGWGGITPESILGKNGFGAFEVAARYSSIDLSDADLDGGEQDNLTLGLNWYMTPRARLMANYVTVLEHSDEDEPSLFQVRAQYDF